MFSTDGDIFVEMSKNTDMLKRQKLEEKVWEVESSVIYVIDLELFLNFGGKKHSGSFSRLSVIFFFCTINRWE